MTAVSQAGPPLPVSIIMANLILCYHLIMKRVPLILLAVLLAVWFYYPARCLLVMPVYSEIHRSSSVMRQKGFDIRVPGGLATPERDWFASPFVYNASEFKSQFHDEVDLTIIYTFPAFDPVTRKNAIFDKGSPYYSAFYGAYVISVEDGGMYGFNPDGSPSMAQISEVYRHDYTKLVLRDLGCGDTYLEVDDYDTCSADFIGFEGWAAIDARFRTRGMAHDFSGFRRNYIQYGRPGPSEGPDFDSVTFHGRILVRFFQEYGVTVMLYASATEAETVGKCFEEILSGCEITESGRR